MSATRLDLAADDADRKSDHLRICLEEDVRSGLSNGLERYRLVHQALPEMALGKVDLTSSFLGHTLCAPLLISAMTGGTESARDVNRRLAVAAQECGVAMGLGSLRAGLDDPKLLSTFQVRGEAPDVLLFANLGAVQLNHGYGESECRRAVESVEADALVLHLNPLQEALQPEGDTDFSGLLGKIASLCRSLACPVIVKEVGWGISAEVAAKLQEAGVSAIDVGGAGGTSWSQVESYRSSDPDLVAMAQAFVGWGIPTAESLVQVREACQGLPIIASGGIGRGDDAGIEVAICLALGAGLVGMAHALLRPATHSAEAVIRRLEIVKRQLSIAMFCAGAATLADLTPLCLTRC